MRATRFSASNYGAKTAICELPFARIASDEAGGAGGTCVLRGCVPKKLMVYGGEFQESFRDSKAYGWDLEQPGLTWSRMNENKNKELDRLNGVYKKLLAGAEVEFIEGFGKVIDGHTVEVSGKRYTAKHILIATGAKAHKLPIEGAEHSIISDHVLDLKERPKKMVIVGGGYIAVEFAGIFNNFGTDVHLVYRQPQPLRGFDEECRQFITEQYEAKGLNLHPESSPEKIEKNADGTLTIHLKKKSGESYSIGGLDQVLMATGRKPNTAKLGLKEAGVELDEKSGAVIVNDKSQSNVASIWAVGDVTDRIALTPVALMEGMAFAKGVFGGDASAKPDYSNIASAVFSSPPMASVGFTEEEAAEKFDNLDFYTSSFKPMKNTVSGNSARGFMKLVVDADSDTVVGIHMIGPDCAEIMQGFAVAVKMGLKKNLLDTVVGIHPSSAEEFVTMRTPSRQIRNKQPVKP